MYCFLFLVSLGHISTARYYVGFALWHSEIVFAQAESLLCFQLVGLLSDFCAQDF